MKERPLLDALLLAIGGRSDARAWRQNAGLALSPHGGRLIRLAPAGASDLVGIVATPCHCGCGRIYGLHLAIEVKGDRGRQRKEQRDFERMIARLGGVYVLAHSIDDVTNALP